MAALRNVLSVLHVYWTEIAEFCAATRNQRWSHAIRTKLAKNRKKRDPKKNEEKIYTKRQRLVNEKKLANSTGSTAHARDATHVVVTRYTYGLTRNSVLHQIQCITPLSECETNFGVSPCVPIATNGTSTRSYAVRVISVSLACLHWNGMSTSVITVSTTSQLSHNSAYQDSHNVYLSHGNIPPPRRHTRL